MLVFILVVVACCVYAIWDRQRRWTLPCGPPIVPDSLPIIGHAPLLPMDHSELWQLIQKVSNESLKANGVVTLRMGPRTVYVLTDPEDSLTAANTCLAKSEFYDFAKPWLGQGLISADVPTWKYHRKLLTPSFSQQVLDSFTGVFNTQARRLVDALAEEAGRGEFDHWPYLALNGLETICSTAMGLEISGIEKVEHKTQYFHALEETFQILIERATKVWLYSDQIFRLTGLKRRQDKLIEILHRMSNEVLQRRKVDLNHNNNSIGQSENSSEKFKTLLDRMLELGVFSDQEIREHLDTMIVAGHDTSANTLMYTLVLLGSHPDVQERVFQELQEMWKESVGELNKHDLAKLVYTEAVVKESLRLYPIFPIITRTIDKDLKLKNYTLDSHAVCLIIVYGIHRHSCWGPDAQVFRPERWLDPATLPANPAFAGFSLGRRGCIGKNYAMMSMKTTLAHVVRRYKVTSDVTKLKLKLGVMLKPAAGHHIAIEERIAT